MTPLVLKEHRKERKMNLSEVTGQRRMGGDGKEIPECVMRWLPDLRGSVGKEMKT